VQKDASASARLPLGVDARLLWTHPSLVIDYYLKWKVLAKPKKREMFKKNSNNNKNENNKPKK
jgi:hypothetical protein